MQDGHQSIFEDPGLSWSQLRAFEACARLSSFKGAALSLSLTASAVRFQIALLEGRLGITLFERHGGRLALTEIGQTFAQQTSRPIQELLAACARARQSALDAPITLTAPPLFARHFLLSVAFLKWCDANRVRLDVSDTKRDLFGPSPIAAIRLDAKDDPELTATPLLRVELCIAASPMLAAHAQPHDPRWWALQTLLCPSASEEGWKTAWQALKITEDVFPRLLPYTSYAAAMEAACAGTGLILAPLPFATTEITEGRLVPVSDIRIQAVSEYSLLIRKEFAGSPRGRALTRHVLRTCERTSPPINGLLLIT
jgi:LysR family transcriptional regulator, glycine cleavage system transcriptional activator